MAKKVRSYSTEFKAEAVKKIADNNGNISATAKQLSIAMQTLSNWHKKANQQIFSISSMCRVLSVKPSSYYDWLSRDISDQHIHCNQSELLVKAAHSDTKERYGYERLHAHPLPCQGSSPKYHNMTLSYTY